MFYKKNITVCSNRTRTMNKTDLISMFPSAFRIDPLLGGCVNNGFREDNTCGCVVEDYNLVGEHCSLGM